MDIITSVHLRISNLLANMSISHWHLSRSFWGRIVLEKSSFYNPFIFSSKPSSTDIGTSAPYIENGILNLGSIEELIFDPDTIRKLKFGFTINYD